MACSVAKVFVAANFNSPASLPEPPSFARCIIRFADVQQSVLLPSLYNRVSRFFFFFVFLRRAFFVFFPLIVFLFLFMTDFLFLYELNCFVFIERLSQFWLWFDYVSTFVRSRFHFLFPSYFPELVFTFLFSWPFCLCVRACCRRRASKASTALHK